MNQTQSSLTYWNLPGMPSSPARTTTTVLSVPGALLASLGTSSNGPSPSALLTAQRARQTFSHLAVYRARKGRKRARNCLSLRHSAADDERSRPNARLRFNRRARELPAAVCDFRVPELVIRFRAAGRLTRRSGTLKYANHARNERLGESKVSANPRKVKARGGSMRPHSLRLTSSEPSYRQRQGRSQPKVTRGGS